MRTKYNSRWRKIKSDMKDYICHELIKSPGCKMYTDVLFYEEMIKKGKRIDA